VNSASTAGRILSIALIMGAIGVSASAFTFEPISRSFSPSGTNATQSFICTNTDNHDIAVKVSMVTRTMDEHGHETYSPASADFVVFPSQIVLKPNSSQVIRVQWRGPATLAVEQNFRIIAQQLPVDFGQSVEQGGNIHILFQYLGSIYVTPADAKPDVVVQSTKAGVDSHGKQGLLLTLRNNGTAHALLNELTLMVSGKAADGNEVKLSFGPAELGGINGENMLARSTRTFFLPVSGVLPEQDVHVELKYNPSP